MKTIALLALALMPATISAIIENTLFATESPASADQPICMQLTTTSRYIVVQGQKWRQIGRTVEALERCGL